MPGLLAASFPFFPIMGSNVSLWPSFRFRSFFGAAAEERLFPLNAAARASMRFATFRGAPSHPRSYRDGPIYMDFFVSVVC